MTWTTRPTMHAYKGYMVCRTRLDHFEVFKFGMNRLLDAPLYLAKTFMDAVRWVDTNRKED